MVLPVVICLFFRMKMKGMSLSRTVGDLVGTAQVVTDVLRCLGGFLYVNILKRESGTRSTLGTVNVDNGLLTSNRTIQLR